jgi:serine/threonine protein kinase
MTLAISGSAGTGTFGDVFICLDAKTKAEVAVKRFTVPRGNPNIGILSIRELNAFATLSGHPYIVEAIAFHHKNPFDGCIPVTMGSPGNTFRNDKVFVSMPKAAYDVLKMIKLGMMPTSKDSLVPVPIEKRLRILYHVLSGVHRMHQCGLAHRDIKTNNMLCFSQDGRMVAKLADFGMVLPLVGGDSNSLSIGNMGYLAPEILAKDRGYGFGIDIWALGICFFEIATGGTDLYPIQNDQASQLSVILDRGVAIDRETKAKLEHIFAGRSDVADFIDLIGGMVRIDATKRLTASQCLSHPFIKQFEGQEGKVVEVTPVKEKLGSGRWSSDPSTVDGPLDKEAKKLFVAWIAKPEKQRVAFMALDLLHRCSASRMHWKRKLASVSVSRIAATCFHVADKFYHECSALPYEDTSGEPLSVQCLESLEKEVLKSVKYRVWRMTMWDCDKQSYSAGELLEFLSESWDGVMAEKTVKEVLAALSSK